MTERRPIYSDTEHERMFEKSHLNIEEAHARAQKVLVENEIKPKVFAGLYGEDILRHDTDKVQRLEGLFEPSPTKAHAEILEAVIFEHGELSEWFGPNSQIIKTARFDDYINKVDMVVETATGERQFSHLALGVDVTFGSKDLHKKFDAIRAAIDHGHLGEIKYFHSDRQHLTGRLSNIPQIVVGIEIEQVRSLGLLWMNRRNNELAVHPVQITILEEASLQLETFAAYARGKHQNEIASILEQSLQKVNEILEEKKSVGIKALEHDKVFDEIRRNLISFTTSV